MSIKKMCFILLCLILVYSMIQFGSSMKKEKGTIEYEIKNDHEVWTVKEKENHYFEISNQEKVFGFYVDEKALKGNYLIKDIPTYTDDTYTCIYPVFKNEKQVTDILCESKGTIYPYQSIKNEKLESFQKQLEGMYSEENYFDNTNETLKKDQLVIYPNNLVKNHFLSLEHYKGIYLINEKENYKKINLFDNDQYKKNISIFYNNKYFVADYHNPYTFHEFYLVDIKSGKQSKITSDQALSLDAYVMGGVEEKVYIYDRSQKEQYAVSLNKKTIHKIGNTSSGIQVYKNGKWNDYSSYDAYDKMTTFSSYTIVEEEFKQYERVDKVGNYYYAYRKQNDSYQVYQIPVLNTKIKTYIFETTDVEDIAYEKGYVYFIFKNKLYYYHSSTGIKTVLLDKELEYNKSLKFGVTNS